MFLNSMREVTTRLMMEVVSFNLDPFFKTPDDFLGSQATHQPLSQTA